MAKKVTCETLDKRITGLCADVAGLGDEIRHERREAACQLHGHIWEAGKVEIVPDQFPWGRVNDELEVNARCLRCGATCCRRFWGWRAVRNAARFLKGKE